MPTYSFKDTNTGEEWTDMMSISDMQKLLSDNQNIVTIPKSSTIVRGVNHKPDNGFREVLQKVKAAHPLGNVNTF